jgi:hypothetical protein
MHSSHRFSVLLATLAATTFISPLFAADRVSGRSPLGPAVSREVALGSPSAKLTYNLRRVQSLVAAELARTGRHSSDQSPTELWRAKSDGRIQVYVYLQDASPAAVAAIESEGVVVELLESRFMKAIQTWLTPAQIDRVSALANVTRISLPGYAHPRTGAITTEGDESLKSSTIKQSPWCLDGDGVKVGIISDNISHANDAAATGDLPTDNLGDADIETPGFLPAEEGDEGTAMLEIVHDMAPNAALAFYGPTTSMEMVDAIQWLDQTAECDVICDDLGFFDQPFFEDGPIAEMAETAVGNGRVYVAAAGNEADAHYQGLYSNVVVNKAWTGAANYNVHKFNAGGDYTINVTVPKDEILDVFMQWNDQFGSSDNDYDLFIINNAETQVLDVSQETQDGNDNPEEVASWENDTGAAATVKVVVRRLNAPTGPKTLELFLLGPVTMTEHVVAADSIFGHPAAAGVIAVAAVDSADTPCGVEDFSSRGPSTISFPAEVRDTPTVAATDKVHVTGAGCFACADPCPPVPAAGCVFGGTSAAAPHVAGIAAQLLEAKSAATPAQVRTALENGAVECPPAGFDFDTGHGFVNAESAFIHLDVQQYICPTDFNGDGTTDGADLGSFLRAWGDPGCDGELPCPMDLNCDGDVNGDDLGLFLASWGDCVV